MSVLVRAMTTPSTLRSAGSLTHVKFPGTSYGGVGYTIWEHKSRLDDTRMMRVPVLQKNFILKCSQVEINGLGVTQVHCQIT